MSAPKLKPPAGTPPPQEEQCGRYEPERIFTQLLTALENPNIKALEWSQNGQDIVIDIDLYEEEMGKNKELFPELADLGSVLALEVWLLAYGFKLMGTKVILQHPNFQSVQPTAEEPGAVKGDPDLSATKKKKRKTSASWREAASQDTLERRSHLRPLYQYINFKMPELMHPSAEEHQDPGVAQSSQVPAAPGTATAPQLQDTWTSSAPEIPDPEASDTLLPISIDWMMKCLAQQIPPFFSQYK